MKPRIAVLLAAYNGEFYISEQINSILNQVGVELTLFISLDKSSDRSFSICDDFSKEFLNIIFLPYEMRYGDASKNFYRLIRDVDLSEYDYVAFADQDDIWGERKLIEGTYMLNQTQSDGYSSNMTAFWESGKEILVEKSVKQRKFDYLFQSAGAACTYIVTSSSMSEFKKFLIINFAKIQGIRSHDWLIYAYYRYNGYTWCLDTRSYIRYRQHENNVAGVNSGLKGKLKRLKILFSRDSWFLADMYNIQSLCGGIKEIGWIFKNILEIRRNSLESLFLFFIIIYRVVRF